MDWRVEKGGARTCGPRAALLSTAHSHGRNLARYNTDMEPIGGAQPTRFVQPEVVTTHFHLKPGDKVGDFGAGSGYFLKVLSEAVGPAGRVYACEIQKNLVETLGNKARTDGLANVDPLWCDLEHPGGIKIADGALDAGLLINTFFQFEDKAAGLREIGRTLRAGASFFLIDWSDSFAGLGPEPAAVVIEDTARAHAEANGFVFERSFDAGDHHYGLAFKKL